MKQNKPYMVEVGGALHLQRRIKGHPNIGTLVAFPQAYLFSQFKCHEISGKELGWIPNKQSCLLKCE